MVFCENGKSGIAQQGLPVAFNKIKSIFALNGLKHPTMVKGHGFHIKLGKIEDEKASTGFQVPECIFYYGASDFVRKTVNHKTDEYLVECLPQVKVHINALLDKVYYYFTCVPLYAFKNPCKRKARGIDL